MCRDSSPSGGSILITSAPILASVLAQYGPDIRLPTSRTLTPDINPVTAMALTSLSYHRFLSTYTEIAGDILYLDAPGCQNLRRLCFRPPDCTLAPKRRLLCPEHTLEKRLQHIPNTSTCLCPLRL